MIEGINESVRTWQPVSQPVRLAIAARLEELERENARLSDRFTKLELAVSEILAAATPKQYEQYQRIIDNAGVYLSNDKVSHAAPPS